MEVHLDYEKLAALIAEDLRRRPVPTDWLSPEALSDYLGGDSGPDLGGLAPEGHWPEPRRRREACPIQQGRCGPMVGGTRP